MVLAGGPSIDDIMIAQYERAQETAYHTDQVAWEVTSIIWGADTLLFGFVIEAIHYSEARPLIIALSIIGVVITIFTVRIFNVARIAKRTSYDLCRTIEQSYPGEFQLHTKIDRIYPKDFGRRWVCAISALFALAWVLTLFWDMWLLLCMN